MNTDTQAQTILFADIGSSSALYDRLGDAKAHRLVSESLVRMKTAVQAQGGTVLRTVGDSILASFEQTDQAFCGAGDIQQAHIDLPISVRVGFHTGEVIPDAGDVYGHAVNLAARVASFARADEIMATADAVAQLSDRYRETVSGGEMIEMKGVPEPFRVHRLQWQDQTDSVTRVAEQTDTTTQNHQRTRLWLHYLGSSWAAGQPCPELRLGRSDDNDITVQSDEVSRRHARIHYRQRQFILLDDSTNGTYVKKPGMEPFVVRRDSIVLDGNGLICLGESPESDAAQIIKFKLTRD